jgi:hypothetical protein
MDRRVRLPAPGRVAAPAAAVDAVVTEVFLELPDL